MKKILSIVALCLIAVIAGTIIVFSCVDKDYNLNLKNPDYIEIIMNNGAESQSYFKDDEISANKEVYDKVMKLYNESYKQKIMSAIFQGTLGNKVTIERNSISESSVTTSGVVIAFHYYENQTLKLNGKTYTYTFASGTTETNIQYKTLYVKVNSLDSLEDVNIYVKNINTSSSYIYYSYKVKANQSALYEYLKENFA